MTDEDDELEPASCPDFIGIGSGGKPCCRRGCASYGAGSRPPDDRQQSGPLHQRSGSRGRGERERDQKLEGYGARAELSRDRGRVAGKGPVDQPDRSTRARGAGAEEGGGGKGGGRTG